MQVKKFEAPTLQEALDTIKRELGPEAIILQTKQNRRGFGLMSKASVEVTAAVSERAVEKKVSAEKRIPEGYKQKLASAPASRQADVYDSYLEKRVERERVQLSATAAQKKITAVRYADIEDDEGVASAVSRAARETREAREEPARIPEVAVPVEVAAAIDSYSLAKSATGDAVREELADLRRLVEELRKERRRAEYLDSDSPFEATDALEEAYDLLIQSGMERRFAVQVMRDAARNLPVEARADHAQVLDHVAARLLRGVESTDFFAGEAGDSAVAGIHIFVGAAGAGKTAMIAKLATHASRIKQEKIGIIRVQLSTDEAGDPLAILAKALHVPHRTVSSPDELQVAIQDLAQCGRIFVDTPGIPARDHAGIRKLSGLIDLVPRGRVHLVVNATVRDAELREQARVFGAMKPASLMFSRLDETFAFGGIYSLARHLGIPVSIFSSGRKVTEQWEKATAERLAASILNIL